MNTIQVVRTALKIFSILCAASLVASCAEEELSCALEPSIVNMQSTTSPIHDPTMIEADGRYYIYSSSDLGTFYSSPDMRSWQLGGQVFNELPNWLTTQIPNANHIGAPDISYYQGRYLYFYQSHISNTCNAATGLATNTVLDPNHPDYLWQDHGLILRSEPHYEGVDVYCGNDDATFNAIDAQFFVDQDNTPWLSFGSTIGGIKLIRLDPQTLQIADDAEFTTLAQRWLFQDDPIIEAPYIKYRDGYYYLFMSFNHCCLNDKTKYQVRVGRAKSVDGPYLDKNGWPLLLGGGSLVIARDGNFIGTGHADVFSSSENDWLVHHAKLPEQDYRAHLQIRKLNWDSEQWPTVCQKN